MAKDQGLLTPTELELMNILWEMGEGTVRDVMALLPPERDLAYTSVSTMVRILEKKGMLASKKDGKTHVYFPTLAKSHYEKKETRSLVKNLFGGSKLSLVKCLIEDQKLSKKEMQELKALISERLE